ncbi:MAG TPA: carboxypeptidase-like regulatory domain-containing protein [Fimbriimonadaceae bacterium]|nr:carboxypeptidase-like regulatory domain-containing protein [Fimbriimonadaceae bacterium]
MKKSVIWALLAAGVAALLGGCGGYTGPKTATITGTVLDLDSNPVRDAHVWTVDGSTVSSVTGAYQLPDTRHGEVKVQADITINGVKYKGANWSLNFDNEQTQNVNIVVGPASSAAAIKGRVQDRNGNFLENVAVYAYNGAGSSARAFTDFEGKYTLDGLLSNLDYTVTASARTYGNDSDVVNLLPGEVRTENFVLGNAGLPNFNPPTNLDVVTWVSHTDPTRAPVTGISPIDAFKQMYDKRYKPSLSSSTTSSSDLTRSLRSDIIVESDLFWDEISDPDLLGFNVYRNNGFVTNLNFLDFDAEPNAAYYVDIGPNVGSNYSYGVTALATLYPDLNNTESGLSNVVFASTLDRLDLLSVGVAPLTFRWLGGSGATEYFVFLFDQFPGVGVDWIWDNLADPATGTSYVYNGPSLEIGRTYYYLVLGQANGGSSRTISQIGSFQA